MIHSTRPGNARRALLALVLFLTTTGCAGKRAGQALLTEDQRALNLTSYDEVFETIREKHWDPALGGTDWDGARSRTRPEVETATTMAQAREAMSNLIATLEQSHFGIIPKAAYDALEERPGGDGELGVELRVLDGEAVIFRVRPGPAHDAGVKPGWVLDAVGERRSADVIARVSEAATVGRFLPYYHVTALQAGLTGEIGTTATLHCRDTNGEAVAVECVFAERDGTRTTFGNFPTQWVRFETRELEDHVAYAALNIFFDPARVTNAFGAFLAEQREASGFILDLRGNPGGIGAMAMGFSGFFTDRKGQSLGTMIMRESKLQFAVLPRPKPYLGPVAVLVDELSTSTSEILAGGLQDIGRARVFGSATPGAALPSVITRLPNGDGFQYAIANYISAGGKALEGHGVVPDEVVPLDAAALAEGRDPVIEAARRWISSESSERTSAVPSAGSPAGKDG